MVYISFLISHVPPAHSFFQKKSILYKSDTKFSSTYYLTFTKKTAGNLRLSFRAEEPIMLPDRYPTFSGRLCK